MTSECIGLEELHNDLSRGKRLPLEGTLELTWRCNLRCPHCYLGEHRETNEATLADWERLADQMAEAGVLRLVLTGGEPLLRKDFRDIYLLLKRKGFALVLFTNGTLVTESDADFLAEYPPAHIEITMYGASAETYQTAAGVDGENYWRACQGAGLLCERGLPLNLKMTVTNAVKDDVKKVETFATEIGAGFRSAAELFKTLNHEDAPVSMRISPEERAKYLVGLPEFDKLVSLAEEKQKKASSDNTLFTCRAGITCFTVNPGLELHLCLLYRKWGYDLRRGSFADGWQKIYDEVRALPREASDPCGNCQVRSLCGVCPALNFLENGDPEQPSRYLCDNAHSLAQVLKRVSQGA